MSKKNKRSRKTDGFGDLDSQLQEQIDGHYSRAQQTEKILHYFGIGLLVCLVLAWFIWSQPAKSVPQTDQSQSSWSNLEETSEVTTQSELQKEAQEKYLASKEEFDFRWTLEDYEALVFGNKSEATGDSLTEILDKYGKASYVYMDPDFDETLVLSYAWGDFQEYEDRRRIELDFYRNGKDYYLSRKVAYDMQDPKFPTHAEGQSAPLLWTEETFNQIQVGDSHTGQGGASYEEVVDIGGLPQEASLNFFEDEFSSQRNLRIEYRLGSFHDLTTLNFSFMEQADGSYRVIAKNATFHKNLDED